jgi:hypothetical protein
VVVVGGRHVGTRACVCAFVHLCICAFVHVCACACVCMCACGCRYKGGSEMETASAEEVRGCVEQV